MEIGFSRADPRGFRELKHWHLTPVGKKGCALGKKLWLSLFAALSQKLFALIWLVEKIILNHGHARVEG
jgi:hypothetical protein